MAATSFYGAHKGQDGKNSFDKLLMSGSGLVESCGGSRLIASVSSASPFVLAIPNSVALQCSSGNSVGGWPGRREFNTFQPRHENARFHLGLLVLLTNLGL